jgi:hypothetical protein
MSKKNGTKSYMNLTFLPKSNIAISMTAPCSLKKSGNVDMMTGPSFSKIESQIVYAVSTSAPLLNTKNQKHASVHLYEPKTSA